MLPDILTDFNVFVDGVGYAGRAATIVLPKVTKKTTEVFNGGMAMPVDVPVGYEMITTDLTFSEPPRALVTLVNRHGADDVQVRLRGDYSDPTDGAARPVEAILFGCIKEIDPGQYQRGEQAQTKFTVSVSYYKYVDDGDTLIEIDAKKPFTHGGTS